MRKLANILAVIVTILAFGVEKSVGETTEMIALPTKPNIVIFISDDQGVDDLGSYGNEFAITPVLDKLAEEGMTFTNAFATSSVCTPSRAAIYTGLDAFRNGCNQNHAASRSDVKSLPHYLAPLGYDVVLAGKGNVKPVSAFPFKYIKREEISDYLSQAGDKPFCLLINYNGPHEPFFNKKSGIDPEQEVTKPWLPDTPETRKVLAAYYDNVNNIDSEIGSHMYWLQKYGFAEDAVQIFFSDHGAGIPYAKHTLYNAGLQVPFIIKWKGVVKPGTKNHAMVSLLDITPTILDMAGGKMVKGLDGRSFLDVISGKAVSHRENVCVQYTNLGVKGASEYPIRTIRTNKYQLIVNLNSDNIFRASAYNDADEREIVDTKDMLDSWERAGKEDAFAANRYSGFWKRPRIELYDMEKDPHQLKNIFDDADNKNVANQMYGELKTWMKQQNDPLLNLMNNNFN